MARPSRYSPRSQERAVRMVREHGPEHPSQWAAIQSIASKLGCTAETLRRWVRQDERDQGRRAGLTTDERQRLKELERENRELKRTNEILRKASAYFRPGGARPPSEVMVGFIDDHRDVYGVESICTVVPIAPSTYFRHKAHQADPTRRSARAQRDDEPGAYRSSASGTSSIRSMVRAKSGSSSAARAIAWPDARCGGSCVPWGWPARCAAARG